MKKRKFIYALLAGLAFTACSNEDQAVQQPQKQSHPLTIEVTENPLIQDGAEGSNSNRAAITTGSTLTSFKLDYVYTKNEMVKTNGEGFAYSVTNTSGTWSTSGIWPEDAIGSTLEDDLTVNWYSYTKGTFYENGGNPYVSFSTDEQTANQHDLLVAKNSGKYHGVNNSLSFGFDHACSALRLSVKKSTNLDGYTLKVTNIALKNVVKVGNYYYNSSSWTPSSNSEYRSNYTLYSGSEITLLSGSTNYVSLNGNFGTNEAPYLFLIPQELTAWNASTNTTGAYISVTCTIIKDATQLYNAEARIPFAKTFEKGKSYDVKINIGKNSLLKTDGTKIINE